MRVKPGEKTVLEAPMEKEAWKLWIEMRKRNSLSQRDLLDSFLITIAQKNICQSKIQSNGSSNFDRLSLMPSEVWVFWWAPELTALYKTLLMKNSAKSQAFSGWVIARKDSILICCKQISADLYLEKA